MDRTHIFLQMEYAGTFGATVKTIAHVALYDAEGKLAFTGQFDMTEGYRIASTGGVDTATRETVVRYLTRACLEHDVGMSTPMYGQDR